MKQLVNAITLYRLTAAFVLLGLLLLKQYELFKWGIAFSFFTDAIDGTLARRFKVTSTLGSRLDSFADEATVLVAIIGLFTLHREFFLEHLLIMTVLVTLYITQNAFAIVAYGKITSFHTILAKTAAILQGFFFIMMFFQIPYAELVFYFACVITGIELVEEILITVILQEWKTDVRGIFWLLKERKKA
jgi:CDP-diacylglycerol--glycerol-3-phosphate 3-phosphatidyltransferase